MKRTPPINAPRTETTPNLETMLATWQSATVRLEKTHEALRDEVRRLTGELEAKDRRLAAGERVADAEAPLGRIAADVRNNLVPIMLNLSLLRRRVTDDPIALNILGKIEAGLATVDADVSDFLHFVSPCRPRPSTFSLAKLTDEVLASFATQLAAQKVNTAIDVPQNQSVRADRNMIRQALVNLVLNALDAMPEGGTLTVTSAPTKQGLELEVADTGPGLPENAIRRVFDPFFTTKSGGTGLGLAIVHRVVEAHGGYVTAMNCPEGGAAFTLFVPRSEMKAAA
jgi:signal transduction histidine kinase